MNAGALRPFLVGGLLSAAVAGLVFAWRVQPSAFRTLERVERGTLDLRFRLRPTPPPDDRVAVIAYDDRTLSERPELFERRAGVAVVVDALASLGPKVIGLDLLFTEPEQVLSPELVVRLRDRRAVETDPEATALLDDVLREASGDAKLVESLRAAGNVVLGFHAGAQGVEPGRDIARGKYAQVSPGPAMPPAAERVLVSLPELNKASARMGIVTTFEDEGGAVRDVPLGMRLGASVTASFAMQLAAEFLGVPRANTGWLGETGDAFLGDLHVPSEQGLAWLDWSEAPIPTYSVVDLVEGRVPADAVRGRVALVGFTHLAQDRVNTPFGALPGVHVHATALRQILDGTRLHRATPGLDAGVAFALGMLVTAAFAVPIRARWRVGMALALLGAFSVGGQWAFVRTGVWGSWVGPFLAWSAAVVGSIGFAWGSEGRQGRALRRLFENYLSPELVDELARDPSRANLGGERRHVSVLFSDIVGFTQFSERLAPTELASFLRDYLGPMTRVVLDHGGYVDKYIGDAVMAVYGAPVLTDAHAERACNTAIAMHGVLKALRPVAATYGIDLAIGVGVNSGEVVVGNIGSTDRFAYTVLGDPVNLGSRLEGLTRFYSVFCLVGPRTRDALGPAFVTRVVDAVRVKGKAQVLEIAELCAGPAGEIVRYIGVEHFDAGRRAWMHGDLATSQREFQAFLEQNPSDPVARMYLDRIAALGGEVPGDWDGVYDHQRK